MFNNYFYLQLRLLLYYVCEAIRDSSECLSFWRKRRERSWSGVRNYQNKLPASFLFCPCWSFRVRPLSSCVSTHLADSRCSRVETLTVLLAQEQIYLWNCQKSWSMRSGWGETSASIQCQSRIFSWSVNGNGKINKTDYICSNERKTVCSWNELDINGVANRLNQLSKEIQLNEGETKCGRQIREPIVRQLEKVHKALEAG